MNPTAADRISDPRSHTLEEDLAGAHAMVTFNSTCGQEALLMGVPVFCDPMAIYAEVANLDLADLEKPKWHDTEDYFNRLGYSQWVFDEFRTGEPIAFLRQFIQEAR